ncbi:MAG TPA: SsrA-binding protein SmpB [Candidatus Eisenbacteria bacterium]|nr:SsrA-binding protein SmpB [Candidatus Eisenbacteria bacterium]
MARGSTQKDKKDEDERKVIATNRKARHDYTVIETFEAGIELRGSEVKSLRAAKAQLVDAYASVDAGQLYLRNAHISPYDPASYENHDPTRARRLLMHKQEIKRLQGQLEEKGLTLVPLSLYFWRGKVKVQLGLARGKKHYDKRDKLEERRAKREVRGAMRGERQD